jgi:hypothetical protein
MNADMQKILQENDVDKISFYFMNSAVVNNAFTTCVLINSSKQRIEARGVSICSLSDTFSKSEGKNKALGRAIKALVRKENNWKINWSGRRNEFVKRSLKVKTQNDEDHFQNVVAVELARIEPSMDIIIASRGNSKGQYKTYSFELPVNYPISLANTLYKYKSHYRPVPSGVEELDLMKRISIFTEPIEDLGENLESRSA